MPDRSDVEAFKNELKNLTYYWKKIDLCNNEIAYVEYEMRNVKGVDYSKQSGNSYNPSAIEEKRLYLSERLEKLIKKRKKYKIRLSEINEVLNRMDEYDRIMVVDVIANKKKYRDACKEYGIENTSTLYARINEIIENALT